jgi:hypothetical protein
MTVAIFMLVSRYGQRGCTIMVMEGARKLVGGVLGLALGAARHALWYVAYQVEGVTRDDPRPRAEPAEDEA